MHNLFMFIMLLFCLTQTFAEYEACVTYCPKSNTYTVDQYGNVNRTKDSYWTENYGKFAEDWGEQEGFAS